MKNTFLLLIIFLSLQGCDEDFFTPIVEVDLPEVAPKLVIYSHMEEGADTLNIIVTTSRGILDNRPFPVLKSDTFWFPPGSSNFTIRQHSTIDTVNQVRLELYKNNTSIAEFYKHPGFLGVYTAVLNQPLKYEVDVSYTLKASAPGFESIEAVSAIPQPVPIDSISYRRNIKVADPNDPTSLEDVNEFSLSFSDPAGVDDYYKCSAIFQDTIWGVEHPRYIFSLDFKSIYDLLDDASFDGKATIWNVHENANHPQEGQYMVFSLHHISASFYQYSLSARRYDDAEDNPFAEPVILYSNVKNGYGVFSMGSTRKYKIQVR